MSNDQLINLKICILAQKIDLVQINFGKRKHGCITNE